MSKIHAHIFNSTLIHRISIKNIGGQHHAITTRNNLLRFGTLSSHGQVTNLLITCPNALLDLAFARFFYAYLDRKIKMTEIRKWAYKKYLMLMLNMVFQ